MISNPGTLFVRERMHFGYRNRYLVLPMLFLVSAFIGAWVSYIPSAAWSRFGQIGAGVIVYFMFATFPEQIGIGSRGKISIVRIALAVLPTIVTIYFVLTDDWASLLGKLPWLDTVLYFMASLNIKLQGLHMDANTFGGAVVALVPLQIGALMDCSGRLNRQSVVLLFISAMAILLSESRGAWLALITIVGIWTLWKISGYAAERWLHTAKHQAQIVISMAILFLITLVGALILSTAVGQDFVRGRIDRLELWQNSLALVGDYPFTGIGLGGFPMAYSSYVVLLPVNYAVHAHDLYLDLWLDQGLLGLGTIITLIGIAVLPVIGSLILNRQVAHLDTFALASLGVILLHGFVDDPFHGLAIVFLFVPLGLLARQEQPIGKQSADRSHLRVMVMMGVAVAVLSTFAVLSPPVRAMFIANIGALNQTQAELSVYQWPDVPLQDELRRSNRVDLTPAITKYEIALAIDPHNETANRRLAQIEMSSGRYASAQEHLEAAYAISPNNRATRQMLGELSAISGNADNAIALWKDIDVSHDQLAFRQWWYTSICRPDLAALIKLDSEFLSKQTNQQLLAQPVFKGQIDDKQLMNLDTNTQTVTPTLSVTRRVNVPNLAGVSFNPAVFWFGKVDGTNNSVDIRANYYAAPSDLGELDIYAHVIDRRLWESCDPVDLPNWDAVSLYISRDGNVGGAPSTHAYRLEGELGNTQATYQWNGSGWAASATSMTVDSTWRGDCVPNSGCDAKGWEVHFRIPFSSLGLSSNPSPGTIWGLGIVVHDRDDPFGTVQNTIWPEIMNPNVPSTWGQLSFGQVNYTPPNVSTTGDITILRGTDNVVDGMVGGDGTCGGGLSGIDYWSVWGGLNYAGSDQVMEQNEWDISDWPCFSKFYITFPTTSIPTGQSIISATLTMHLFGTNGGGIWPPSEDSNIQILTTGQDFDGATLNWNNAPLATENVATTFVPPIVGDYTWDISYALAKAYAAGQPLRLAVYSSDSGQQTGKYFLSSHNSNVSGRPSLKIVYGK